MKYTVVGAAKSGFAAALLAKRDGHEVFVTESKDKEYYSKEIEEFERLGIRYEFGSNTPAALKDCDIVITSPGVPPTAWVIAEADKCGIPVISELEFASRHINGNKIVAVTGTNGKTTTTSLISFILEQAGKHVITAGNIGLPLSACIDSIRPDSVIVVEVSSFQLDRTIDFRPDVALILNITPDHLYYHGTMESYINAKWKISSKQNENNLLILNGDDSAITGGFDTKSTIAYFSMSPVDRGIFNSGGKMVIKLPNKHEVEEIMLFSELSLPGVHNAYNSMAAALAARALEIRNENIRDSLMKFSGVEHRLEFVRTLDGIDYINDSKATNINATWYALSSYSRPIIWIAGGRGDNNDYSQLDGLAEKNVKAIIAIGEEADSIFNHFCTKLRCRKELTFEDAVAAAREEAEFGDIVLFTPACKSFDMFANFEHRGEVFKKLVNGLA